MSHSLDYFYAIKTYCLIIGLAVLSTVSIADNAYAESKSVVDILPASSGEHMAPTKGTITHPPLRLTPDKSELIRLNQEAGSVILGNHASILAESPSLLVVVPKTPGATYFTILSPNGEVVMQRHVIVASPKENYVRVRKACTGSEAAENDACNDTNVYYCPDMCHNIAASVETDDKATKDNDEKSEDKDSDSSYTEESDE